MNLGATLVASFLVTLARPSTWPLAMLAFLVRGGVLVILLPIVAIPSAVGLANLLAPTIVSFVFGGLSLQLVLLVAAVVLAALLLLVGGGLLAALAEAELVRIVATDEETVAGIADARRPALPLAAEDDGPSSTGPPTGDDRDRGRGRGVPVPVRILAARLIAHVPLIAVLAWGSVRMVATTYRELTNPSDVGVPILLRVLGAVPDVIVLLVVAWVVGEIVGGLAARYIVLAESGVVRALTGAMGHMIRRPLRALVLAVVPGLAVLAVMLPSAAAAAVGWDAIRASLAEGRGVLVGLVLLLMFIGLWAGGLVLAAVAAAWRAAVWTLDVAMTFGPSTPDLEGEWQMPSASATLGDLRPPGVDPDSR